MKKIVQLLGIAIFWLSWPISYVYLQRTERTRVLLVTRDHVLLIRNWHGTGDWTLPGGGIHKHEEPIFAATRELKEEVGIALGVDQLRPLGTKIHTEHGLTFTCQHFIGSLDKKTQTKPRLPEILDAEWVRLDGLARYRLASDVQYALSASGALVQ
jgi:8-oxo-dGTP pyrophosphatase MutT (NUDIX family)